MTTEAVYVLNSYVANDPVLSQLFAPNSPQPFPLLAEEPGLFASNSFPYIRYLAIPIIDGFNFRIRRDTVQYIVGEKDFVKLGAILERLIAILNVEDGLVFPIKDTTGHFNIQSVELTIGTPINFPSQDEGVFERGLNLTLIYTVLRDTKFKVSRVDFVAQKSKENIYEADCILI